MILADENIDAYLVSKLRAKKIKVTHIKEGYSGISDEKVINLSLNSKRIILTEDKDFGEWVYSHNERRISVILLRYDARDSDIITTLLLNLLESRGKELFGKFTTITRNKIRIRSTRVNES